MAYLKTRRVAPGYRSARSRPSLAWNGTLQQAVPLVAGTPTAFYLWDDVNSSTFNLQGHGTHYRSIMWLTARFGSLAARASLAWYLAAFTTDGGGNVPTQLIYSPLAGQATMIKEMMDWGMVEVSPTAGTAQTGNMQYLFRDVKARRRISDTDAILLVLESTAAMTIDVGVRTLMKLT